MPKEIVTSGGLFTGVAISGATAATYELTADDVEELLYCEVTATNTAGSAMKQSDATGEIEEAPNYDEATANILLNQDVFSNATDWVPGADCTVTANAIAAPDGTMTADLLGFVASSADSYIGQPAALTMGTQYTFSVWLKGASAQTIRIHLSKGQATPEATTVCSVTTSWQKFTVTLPSASFNGTHFVQIGYWDAGSAPTGSVYAWHGWLRAS